MKKIFITLVILIGATIALQSCKKKEELINNQEFNYSKAGKMHNKILDYYYTSNINKKVESFEERIDQIDNYLSQTIDQVKPGTFRKIIDENSTLKERMYSITENNNLNMKLLVQEMLKNDEISINLFMYLNEITAIYEQNMFDFDNIIDNLNLLHSRMKNDDSLNQNEKNKLEAVIQISISSAEYWNSPKNRKFLTQKTLSLPWYEKDVAGALAGISSGLVLYANSIGPWGGAAALIGSAALGSAIPD